MIFCYVMEQCLYQWKAISINNTLYLMHDDINEVWPFFIFYFLVVCKGSLKSLRLTNFVILYKLVYNLFVFRQPQLHQLTVT